jgi:hypothetical protein
MKGEMMAHTMGLDAVAHLAGEMTDAAMVGQAIGLRLLFAEMQALTQVMPGRAPLDAGHMAADAEIEADFDNMPV